MDNCDDNAVKKAADALDNGDDALFMSTFNSCVDDLRKDWNFDAHRRADFVTKVAREETKGKGMDMSLRYEFSGTAYAYLTGFDIK